MTENKMRERFLPVTRQDMVSRGWERPDFVLVSGDAYVDHPSFGHAIIARVLEAEGFRVCILAQPAWRDCEDFKRFGRPRYGFLISSGVIDSMVNHYTAAKKPRTKDAYSPGGRTGCRPNRNTIVYANRIREAYGDIPLIIGGLEPSLRRFAHYDYWDDRVRRSILDDTGADLISYGMGERSVPEICRRLAQGVPVDEIQDIPGTCYWSKAPVGIELPSARQVSEDKRKYAEAFAEQYRQMDPVAGKTLCQLQGSRYVVQNKPDMPLGREEMDRVYGLPYTRQWHPDYDDAGGVPALEEVKFSVTATRGCFGACSFCALAYHQGRIAQSRSHESVIAEVKAMTHEPDFKGYIHDVGGPTANFRRPACDKQLTHGLCRNRRCMFPTPCKNLVVDHKEYVQLLRKLRAIPGVKKVFIRSGIRFDYVMADPDDTFMRELVKHHISGQLKVAPEHVSGQVLRQMGKPARAVYDRFVEKYYQTNIEEGMRQYLVPYFMSSHPGSDLKAAVELAEYLRDIHHQPEQVQDFYPTPGTLSTCMFYTGLDPLTMKPVYVPKSMHEKAMQRALMQYRNPKNFDLVREALHRAGREDLIGFGGKCLVPPAGSQYLRPEERASMGGVPRSRRTGGRRNGRGRRR